jgi:hypothetical protein
MAPRSPSGLTFRSWLPFLAAAPALGALAFSLGLLLVVAIGGRTRWLDFTMAEAALVGDVGRVFRLLEAGESPEATYSIRVAPAFETKATSLTPLQAAVAGDKVAVLMLLFEHGVSHDQVALNALWCQAREKNSYNIKEWLEKQGGVVPSGVNCP